MDVYIQIKFKKAQHLEVTKQSDTAQNYLTAYEI